MAKQQKGGGKGRRQQRKKIQVESNGAAYVKATFNNDIITLTDSYGNTISWGSAGKQGFKGSRKNTAAGLRSAAASEERRTTESEVRPALRVRPSQIGAQTSV